MKFVKTISLCLSAFLACVATVFFAFSAIDHNPQQEYCHVIGDARTALPADAKVFIKTKSGHFAAYDAQAHANATLFYVQHKDAAYDFNAANWQSVNGFCRLKKEAYVLIATTFLLALPVSFVFVFIPLLLGHALLARGGTRQTNLD